MTKTLSDDEIAQMRRELTAGQFAQEMECSFEAANDNGLIPFADVQAAIQRALLHEDRYSFAAKSSGWMWRRWVAIAASVSAPRAPGLHAEGRPTRTTHQRLNWRHELQKQQFNRAGVEMRQTGLSAPDRRAHARGVRE